jgi:hypothetical protein
VKPQNTIKPLNGAPRDAGRRLMTCVSTDVYVAMVKEQERRKAEEGGNVGMNVIVEDALIAYLGVGSEETE